MTGRSADSERPRLRVASTHDASAIAECVVQAYSPWVPRIGRKPWPMLQDYATVLREALVTVAEVAGKIVGVLVLSITDEGLLIENVAVCPTSKGQGIGRALLQHAESEARRLGCSNLYLYTNELMTENIALYARYGYQEYERREEQGFCRVFMRKTISQDA